MKRTTAWMLWFLVIISWTYSPLIAPAGVFSPYILGLPYTLFWWMVLSLTMLFSIILFSRSVWSDKP